MVYLLLCEKFAKSFDNITISSRNVYFFVLATNFNLGAPYILLKVSSTFQTISNSKNQRIRNERIQQCQHLFFFLPTLSWLWFLIDCSFWNCITNWARVKMSVAAQFFHFVRAPQDIFFSEIGTKCKNITSASAYLVYELAYYSCEYQTYVLNHSTQFFKW